MPEWPLPLLGRELRCKLNAQLTFSEDSAQFHIPPENARRAQLCWLPGKNPAKEETIPDKLLNAVIAIVWPSGTPGRAKNVTLEKMELKAGAQLVRKKHNASHLEARKGLEPIINPFWKVDSEGNVNQSSMLQCYW